jgi:predicted nucleic acid-binding protein
MVLVDSNVLTDIFTEDSDWFDWSAAQLARYRNRTALAINPIILAEVAPNFESSDALDEALPSIDFRRLDLPFSAAYLTGQVFARYRRSGGKKEWPLPDFYIGAHAQVQDLELLTRDPRRYQTYFPKVKLIAPQQASDQQGMD